MLASGRALAIAAAAVLAAPAAAFGDSGIVYTSTNAPGGNAIQTFNRAEDGSLTPAGSFATGSFAGDAHQLRQGSFGDVERVTIVDTPEIASVEAEAQLEEMAKAA